MGRIALLTLTLLAGAAAHAVKYEGRLDPGVWEQTWTDTLRAELGASALFDHRETQIEKMCPGYKKDPAKRALFWEQLMVSLSWKESLHGPENFVHFKKGTNDGLFQINPELRTYYECHDYDLFNPLDNIRCAVKMTVKLVKRYGTFLTGPKGGMAAYWQPLRATSRLNRRNRAAILAEVTKACRSGEIVMRCQPDPADGGMTMMGHRHGGGHEFMDEADLSFNDLEELGIPADRLDPVEERADRRPPTFRLSPAAILELSR